MAFLLNLPGFTKEARGEIEAFESSPVARSPISVKIVLCPTKWVVVSCLFSSANTGASASREWNSCEAVGSFGVHVNHKGTIDDLCTASIVVRYGDSEERLKRLERSGPTRDALLTKLAPGVERTGLHCRVGRANDANGVSLRFRGVQPFFQPAGVAAA